ncbi:hypothetical protein HPO96_06485 [Kribbella sandramycini]|uniref:DUF6817 domain-containing protein n=1 Tax=Kribbella sandramycini TaxID=60450 RepID=A0A7Y4KW94_9ACTN|nr:hypothetical protein [Kribbella sandramycini]MBB6567508.1 hypothetical protein [Kribbella sandramycini]NOL39885.1 hypothetical protein [Kribbella sandramycini]
MSTFQDLGSLLLVRGADEIEHAGGSLYVHLHRVAKRLAGLGASETLVLAGLGHAAYGTDGFPTHLFDWQTERPVLESVIGADAEALVYAYGATDRETSWRDLAEHRTIADRFTGTSEELGSAALRDLVDLTIVNELDVLDHAPSLQAKLRPFLQEQIPRWQSLASPAVLAEAQRVLQLGAPAA